MPRFKKRLKLILSGLLVTTIAAVMLVLLPFGVEISTTGFLAVRLSSSVVLAAPGWESPTSSTGNGWTNPDNAWDESTTSYALYDVDPVSWSPWLELHIAEIQCDKVQVFVGLEKDGVNIDSMELDAYYDGSYNNIYTGVVTIDTWQEYSIPAGEKAVTAIQARFYNNHGAQSWEVYFYEADLWEVEAIPEIANTPGSYNYLVVDVSSTTQTAINYFQVENIGDVMVDVTIQGIDFSGGDDTWILSDTATPGENIAGLVAGLDDADDTFDTVVKKTPTYNTLIDDLDISLTQDWGLKIYMPTTVPGYDGQVMTSEITLVCSASY